MVADNDREKAETQAGLGNRQQPAERFFRSHISVSERKKGVAAEIPVREGRLFGCRNRQRRLQGPVDEGETDHKSKGPKPE